MHLAWALPFACALGADPDPDPAFSRLWDQNLVEGPAVQLRITSGAIPAWLEGGRLVRNGPGQFYSEHRNFSWAFDGLAKLYSWSFDTDARPSGGEVTFRQRFVNSKIYNKTLKDRKIPKMMTVGGVTPKFNLADGMMPMTDNVNVNVWKLQADPAVPDVPAVTFTTTDSVDSIIFDDETLETTKIERPLAFGPITCAHPHYEPGTNGTSLVNFVVNTFGIGNSSMTAFRVKADGKRQAFGLYKGLAFTPYVHSFSVTQDHMVVLVYPTAYNMVCMAEGTPLHECMDWRGDTTPTKVLIFDLHSTDPKKPPIGVTTTDAFHVQHHINAYQKPVSVDGTTTLVVDTAAYTSPTFWTSKFPFGDLGVMKDRDSRNHIQGMATLRRLEISLTPAAAATAAPTAAAAAGVSVAVTHTDIPVTDAAGKVYSFDFPFINRGDGGYGPAGSDGKPYCVFYAFTCGDASRNGTWATEMASWATLKVDLCQKDKPQAAQTAHSQTQGTGAGAGTAETAEAVAVAAGGNANAVVWYRPQHYPQEPIFVPRPGGTAEDDGVLLSNVLDGGKETTYLSILDASSLREVARVDFAEPQVLPYMQHAAYFK
jgi:carotenoid cleavage dioxygenase-like enzyme